jgi:Zn-dependent peptidase ImmA (M78 family)
MLLTQLFESATNDATLMDMLPTFLPLALEILELRNVPNIKLEKFIDDEVQPTFGKFVSDENIIYLGIANRHPVDILRTLAHEMVHYKQNIEHEIDSESGRTGSPQENQAHEIAGVIMREFNKANPEFLKAKPLEF